MCQTQGMVDEKGVGTVLLACLGNRLRTPGPDPAWRLDGSPSIRCVFVESDASRFVSEQQATARLIDEVQSEEGDLSSVFYFACGAARMPTGTILLKRLDSLEAAIRRTIEAGARLQRLTALDACPAGGRPVHGGGPRHDSFRPPALQRLLSDAPKPARRHRRPCQFQLLSQRRCPG